MDSDVEFLLTWARDKEMHYRSEFNRGGETIKLILSWFSSGMLVMLGFLVAYPTLDEGTKAILIGAAVFGIGLYLGGIYNFAGKSQAAVENWTAMRFAVLQELPFLIRMEPDAILNLLMQIDNEAGQWFSLNTRELYRRTVKRAKREHLVPRLTLAMKDPKEAVRFVKGETSGPWDFVPGIPP